jgi:hypothetical protein
MAFVGARFFMVVTFIDSGNNTSHMRIQLDVADMAAALTAAAADIGSIAAVTKSFITRYTIERQFDNDGSRTPAGEVEEKALLTMLLAGAGNRLASVHIPAPVDTIFVGAAGTRKYNDLDTSDGTLLAFADHYNTGDDFFLSDGEHAQAVVDGKRIHRGSTRG